MLNPDQVTKEEEQRIADRQFISTEILDAIHWANAIAKRSYDKHHRPIDTSVVEELARKSSLS